MPGHRLHGLQTDVFSVILSVLHFPSYPQRNLLILSRVFSSTPCLPPADFPWHDPLSRILQISNWPPAVTVCSDRILQIGVSPPTSLQGLPVSPGKVQSPCQPSTVAGSWGVCSQLKQASTLPPGFFLSVSYGSWHSELKCPPLYTSKCHSSVAVCLFYNGIPSHSLHCYFVLFLSVFLFSVRKPDL